MSERDLTPEFVVRTKRDQIRGVADRWGEQYYRPDGWLRVASGDSEEVWRKLAALDKKTATPEDVDAIIGNDSWTRLLCDHCSGDQERVVRVGDEPDYDAVGAWLCEGCLSGAARALAAMEEGA